MNIWKSWTAASWAVAVTACPLGMAFAESCSQILAARYPALHIANDETGDRSR